ncbi:hypothetical protein ACT7DH_20730 [Bacillus pacificus]
MEQTLVIQKKKRFGFSQGIGITLLIAIVAKYLAGASIFKYYGTISNCYSNWDGLACGNWSSS